MKKFLLALVTAASALIGLAIVTAPMPAIALDTSYKAPVGPYGQRYWSPSDTSFNAYAPAALATTYTSPVLSSMGIKGESFNFWCSQAGTASVQLYLDAAGTATGDLLTGATTGGVAYNLFADNAHPFQSFQIQWGTSRSATAAVTVYALGQN